MAWNVAFIYIASCHVYNDHFACIPRTVNPRGGVTVRNCAWLYEDEAEDAGQ